MAYDTLIIGAGMSGLAAGIRLAQFDRRVLILERHSLWGGLNSFYKLKGRMFDSGLHALTNFAPRHAAGLPLTRILRQLRIPYEALKLGEQAGSRLIHAGRELRFHNDPRLFFEEFARVFPGEIDGLRRLVADFPGYDAPPGGADCDDSARARLSQYIRDPAAVDCLMLPTCIYGSAREDDVDWDQFTFLFRAIFLEGFSRPEGGIKSLLDLLLARLKAVGGELRTNCGVRRILTRAGSVTGVELDSGEEIPCERVFSSAGHTETLRLLDPRDVPSAAPGRDPAHADQSRAPRLSYFESISVTAEAPAAYGYGDTVTFFNLGERFRYRVPTQDIDSESGVICSPNNFARTTPLAEGMLRLTVLANHAHWTGLAPDEYAAAKQDAADRMLAAATRAVPALSALPPRVLMRDTFTPRTLEHYTGHLGGAVYGAPRKSRDGTSGVGRLSLIGTDQGMLGIIGALLSGITIANHHVLAESLR